MRSFRDLINIVTGRGDRDRIARLSDELKTLKTINDDMATLMEIVKNTIDGLAPIQKEYMRYQAQQITRAFLQKDYPTMYKHVELILDYLKANNLIPGDDGTFPQSNQ